MMAAEARRIEAAIPAGALRLALDERGRDLTTMALSHRLEQWRAGGRDVVFLVGGPEGPDGQLKTACDGQLRLSSLTLPPPLVRVVLAEPPYPAWAILPHHPHQPPRTP